jgi:hypothetical protein
MSPRGPLRASKTQKPAFAKTLKNLQFFKVFGVQRHPKRALGNPRRLPRGTQGAPKLQKKGSKNGPQHYYFFDKFWSHFGGHFGVQILSKRGPKIGPVLEPLGAGSQGSRGSDFAN